MRKGYTKEELKKAIELRMGMRPAPKTPKRILHLAMMMSLPELMEAAKAAK